MVIREDPQRDGAVESAAPLALGGATRYGRDAISVRTMGVCAAVGFVIVLLLFTQCRALELLDERGRYCTDSSGRAWAVIVDPMVSLSVGMLALCLAVSMVVAILRRRFALAAAAALVVAGPNVSTQLFKSYWPMHPHLWDNSLPSGHATAAMSVALAAVLVAAPSWRRYLVAVSAFIATFVGAGTIVGHWHRPADVIAAFLSCLAWAALAIALACRWQRRGRSREIRSSVQPQLSVVGASLAGLFFILAGVRPLEHKIKWVEAGVTFGAIGLLSALVLTWVCAVADENLG